MSLSLRILIGISAAVLAGLVFTSLGRVAPMDTLDGCPVAGSARGADKSRDNSLKNRYSTPNPEDFDPNVTLTSMLAGTAPTDLDNSRAVRITGYVRDVKEGGVESCNCHATDPQHRDTHIEVVMRSEDGAKGVVITEVTPRTRLLAAKRGLDWSTDGIRAQLLGRRVTVEGWLYYDPDHIDESFANDPQDVRGKPNWRGTCWEVHPITSIEAAP